MRKVTKELLQKYREHLICEEKADATVEKYVRDITAFVRWLKGRDVDKKIVLEYKQNLMTKYAFASVNSVLSSLNGFFLFNEWYDLKVKALKIQRRIFSDSEKELSKAEYERLLKAAREKGNERLYLLMQTICSTGIRVSELRFITVESVFKECAVVNCKGKMRLVILPKRLCAVLKKYIRKKNIKRGSVFVSRNGKPLDRSNIWSDMKKLCESAGVSENKVFPHNLRHLFARTYYSLQKDVVRLADILGHTSVDTTRIYIMESGETHRRQMQRLGLLLC